MIYTEYNKTGGCDRFGVTQRTYVLSCCLWFSCQNITNRCRAWTYETCTFARNIYRYKMEFKTLTAIFIQHRLLMQCKMQKYLYFCAHWPTHAVDSRAPQYTLWRANCGLGGAECIISGVLLFTKIASPLHSQGVRTRQWMDTSPDKDIYSVYILNTPNYTIYTLRASRKPFATIPIPALEPPPELSAVRRTSWRLHTHCECTKGDELTPSSTIPPPLTPAPPPPTAVASFS